MHGIHKRHQWPHKTGNAVCERHLVDPFGDGCGRRPLPIAARPPETAPSRGICLDQIPARREISGANGTVESSTHARSFGARDRGPNSLADTVLTLHERRRTVAHRDVPRVVLADACWRDFAADIRRKSQTARSSTLRRVILSGAAIRLPVRIHGEQSPSYSILATNSPVNINLAITNTYCCVAHCRPF